MSKKLELNKMNEVVNMFRDEKFGGYFSAINYDVSEKLTLEKSIEDHAILLIGAVKSGNKSLTEELVNYVINFLDDEQGGIIDFREQYGLINELGNIKTTYKMFLVGYSLALAGDFIKDSSAITKSKELVDLANKYCFVEGRYVSKISRNFDKVMNSNETTASLALSILVNSELVEENLPQYGDYLKRDALSLVNKVLENGAVPDVTDKYNSLLPDSKVDGEVAALVSISLYRASKILDDPTLENVAMKVLDFVNQKLWDKVYGGYFTHCGVDGNVEIHKEFVTLLTSAIPVKTSKVNLLVLLANKLVNNSESDVIVRVEKYLSTLYDNVNGGFFIGEGYFWTPPAIPVGPFHRLMLPTRETAGVFYFGASSFLRLYNKYISSQALALIVFFNSNFKSSALETENKIGKSKYVASKVEVDFLKSKLVDQQGVNLASSEFIERHLNYIAGGYTKKIGFGWTPHISPIGTKSDKTPAVFGTHHSIANLKVLGGEIKDKEEVAAWIRCCQSPNGAFGEYPGGPSDVLNTYLAIDLLDILGTDNWGDKEKCIEFLQSCQNEDGGFGVVPGFKSDLFHSNLAAVALKTLGENPKNLDALINYYLSARNEDGGFGEYVGAASDSYSCYRTISTFALYGLEIPDKESTINFIRGCQDKTGGFSNDKIGKASMIATYHCVASLYLLDSEPDDKEGAYNWLINCQTADGGFSNIPKVTTGTIDEGFAAIQSLAMLKGGLSKKWAIYVS